MDGGEVDCAKTVHPMHEVVHSERLKGKRVLVTAAGAGIGRATVLRLAAEGADLIAADIDASALATLVDKRINTLLLDFSNPDRIREELSRIGPVDVLLNGVGWVHQGTILQCSPDDWHRSFRLNVDSMYYTITSVLPGMIERGRGSIINIASIASSVKAVPNRSAYSATKAAVIGLTKSVAMDTVATGVRCNAICPGTIDSPSLQDRINAAADPVRARADFIARQPMGRLGQPEEIAGLAAYLASDESAFMTGAVLIIDGGMAA